jgi:hypothetical protein
VRGQGTELKLHGFSDRFSRWNFLKKDHFSSDPQRWEAVTAAILRPNEEILFTEPRRGGGQSLASCVPLATGYTIFTLVFLVPSVLYLLSSSLALRLLLMWVLITLIMVAYVLPQVMQHACYVLTSEKAVVRATPSTCAMLCCAACNVAASV